MNRERCTQTVTIPISTTDSTAINAKGMVAGSVKIPAALTGSALTFKGSLDGSTWYPLYTAADVAVGIGAVTVGKSHPIPAQCFDWPYIQIVGSSQAAERSFLVSMNG